MYKLSTLGCLLLLTLSAVLAQTDEATISGSDVKHFIEHFPTIVQELEALDVVFDETSGDFNLPEGAEYLADVDKIVKKHGYVDFADFHWKAASVIGAYAALVLSEESHGVQPEIQAAIDEIENSEYYTPEQKEQMKEALLQSAEALQGMSESMADDATIEVVKPYQAELEDMLGD